MGRPIDADAFLRRIQNQHKCYSDEEMRRQMWWFIHKFLPAAIADEPTVDVVVHGEWIDCSDGNATCNVCRTRQRGVYDDDNEQHFCGTCGADMRR